MKVSKITFRGLFVVAALVVSALAVHSVVTNDFGTPKGVARMLRIAEAPASLRNIECSSTAITDVVITCVFDVDGADFDQLSRGWPFVRSGAWGASNDYSGDDLGEAFPVKLVLSVKPVEFNGGMVQLVANARNSRVKLFFYIE